MNRVETGEEVVTLNSPEKKSGYRQNGEIS